LGRREVHIGFWCGNLRERNYFEDLREERIILKWIFKKWDGWACDSWRSLVNAVINLRVP
jgi:hypothetical protein